MPAATAPALIAAHVDFAAALDPDGETVAVRERAIGPDFAAALDADALKLRRDDLDLQPVVPSSCGRKRRSRACRHASHAEPRRLEVAV